MLMVRCLINSLKFAPISLNEETKQSVSVRSSPAVHKVCMGGKWYIKFWIMSFLLIPFSECTVWDISYFCMKPWNVTLLLHHYYYHQEENLNVRDLQDLPPPASEDSILKLEKKIFPIFPSFFTQSCCHHVTIVTSTNTAAPRDTLRLTVQWPIRHHSVLITT